MYNVLIVDDELLMRTYLSSFISAFSNKFQIINTAKDGLEAMELLNKFHYDLVITDIQMPAVNGLNLARYINDNFSDIIVIIISGYDDFDYARQAIKYNVKDYLLKPLVDQTLTDLLESVSERLADKKTSEYLTGKRNSSSSDVKNLLFQAILDENDNSIYELFQELENHGLTLMEHAGTVMKFSLDELDFILKKSFRFDVTTEHFRLNQIIQKYCDIHDIPCLYSTADGATYVLFSAETSAALMQQTDILCREIKAAADQQTRITCIIGKTVHDIMELPYFLQSIREMMPLALLKKEYPLHVTCSEAEQTLIDNIQKVANLIFTDYLTQSMDSLYINIKSFCNCFKDEWNYSSVMSYGFYLIQYICDKSNITTSYKRKAYSELIRQVDRYLQVGLPEESTIIQIYISSVSQLISPEHQQTESTQIVNVAKKYILANYQNNISLSDVAEHCGISSSYLSDLFHKTLKEPYSKYLLRIRMEQAAKLLRQSPNIKIYTVAEQTGFVSTKHFNSVFKKYYGVTPTGYLKSL